MKRIYLILVSVLLSVASFAQNAITIKGMVSDSQGEPMIGATVMEKGTSNGTTTDAAGEYTIKVRSSNAVLIYTSLSYVTVEQPIKGKTVINVTMEDDALSLSEVVVTGYGQTVTKDKLTAAISKVTSDEIGRGSHGNALQTLSGAVTGVRVATTTGQPGTSPSIVIRGGAALDGSGTPLYIIDGVQKPDMSDINSHDIESIEILKDAAATALYGAKANAGVVMVTTKQGREGKAEISFKANAGLNYLRNTNEFLDGADYLYYLRMAAYRSGNIASLSEP